MKKSVSIIFLLFLSLISLQVFSQGKIKKSKKEVKQGNKKPDQPASQPAQSSSSSSSSNDDKTIGELFFEGVAKVFLYITYYSTIGSYKTEAHLHSRVTKYPYYNKQSGNYEKPDTAGRTKNHFHVDADYGFLYSGKNLSGHHVKLNIRPFQYFFVQAQYHELTERDSNNVRSNLSLFNFNLCYDRIRFEKFNLGWKAGICYIANDVNRTGFSLGLDAEAFVIKPVSIYASKQWGAIHRVAVNEFEIGAKFHVNRFNIHTAYEHLKIGSPQYDYVSLGIGVCL